MEKMDKPIRSEARKHKTKMMLARYYKDPVVKLFLTALVNNPSLNNIECFEKILRLKGFAGALRTLDSAITRNKAFSSFSVAIEIFDLGLFQKSVSIYRQHSI